MRGLCECGCGQSVNKRFVNGHNAKSHFNHGWRGGRIIGDGRYIMILDPTHPRSNSKGYVHEHIVLAEKALSGPLPPKAQVHHVNEITADNSPGNLVLCEDFAYHMLLHRRTRAFKATGYVDAVKCRFCNKWGLREVNSMTTVKCSRQKTGSSYHKSCAAADRRKRVIERREP